MCNQRAGEAGLAVPLAITITMTMTITITITLTLAITITGGFCKILPLRAPPHATTGAGTLFLEGSVVSLAEGRKKSFMLYFDNFHCVAALDAEQRGELLLLLYRYAMAADKAPTDPEEVLRQHPGLREETRMAYRFLAETIRRDTEKWKEKQRRYQEAAARRQEPVSRRALERADSMDDSDIWKYVRDFSTASRLPKSEDSGTLDAR